MNKKVFVTGVGGYVGRNLTKTLLEKGYEVYAFARHDPSPFFNKKEEHKNLHIITGDITMPVSLPRGIDIIYHCAGVIKKMEEIERVNVIGTKNITEAARQEHCMLIHLSSAGMIGDTKEPVLNENTACRPGNAYEVSKYKAEIIVKEAVKNGLDARILRPAIIFGGKKEIKGDSFFELLKSMRKGYYRNIGKGIFNIVHINEVVKALVLLGEAEVPSGETYIISNHIAYEKMDEIIKKVEPAVDKKTHAIPYPAALAAAAALSLACFVLHKKNPLTFSRLRALTDRRVYSQKKIENDLHFKNGLSVEEYLKDTCEKYIADGLLA